MSQFQLAAADHIYKLHQDKQHLLAIQALIKLVQAENPHARFPTKDAYLVSAAAARLANQLALAAMQKSDPHHSFDAAITYLRHALSIPLLSIQLQAVTLNNLAIYYSRTRQPNKALRCLQRIARYGPQLNAESDKDDGEGDSIDIHARLNLTTVLADLGRHTEALEMAQEAVAVLEQRSCVDSSLMSAAYYNLAVQQERLGSKCGCKQSYRSALERARRSSSGKSSQMADFISDIYEKKDNFHPAVRGNSSDHRQSSRHPRRKGMTLSNYGGESDSNMLPCSIAEIRQKGSDEPGRALNLEEVFNGSSQG